MNDKAGVIAPPPLIFAASVVLGLLVGRVYPVALLPAALARPVGILLLLVPVPIAVSALRELRKARTPVDPYKPTSAIVRTGAFGFSRNPLYVSLILVTLGIACLSNSLWIFLFLVPAVVVLRFGVIAREEAYLDRKFGDDYRRYKTGVRRWL
jgi:protein-S-isoprenylcysteine O-methyltransferase Ste14